MSTPSPRHLLRQAISAARQGDRSRARMFLAKTTELDPDDPLAWLWRAGLAEEPEQALVWINRALDIDPMHPQALRALPRVRMQAAMAVSWGGDFAMARRLFEQAAEADPDAIEPWIHLAGMGRTPEESLACLAEVLARKPDHAGALQCIEYLEQERRATVGIPTPLSIELPPEPSSLAGRFDTPPDADDRLIPEEFDVPEGFEQPPPPPRTRPAPKRSTVMIVDDNAEVREFVQRHLESLGFSVVDADGADQAVSRIRENGPPDLILLDGVMPRVDGFELCNMLRQNQETAKIPIVLLARNDGWLPRIKGVMSGFNDTLAKPISPASLREMVAKFCPLADEMERRPSSWPELPEEATP